jgi:hypothetical protein
VKRVGRVAAIGLLAGPLIAGCGQPASTAPGPAPSTPSVTLAFCGGSGQPAPDVIDVVCNTDDITARNLHWTSWGKPTATATGNAVIDLCAYTDCHTGSFGSVAIKLTATGIGGCGDGRRAYMTLRYTFPHGSPWGSIPADVSAQHFMVGSDRPLPPHDQTVAMACG